MARGPLRSRREAWARGRHGCRLVVVLPIRLAQPFLPHRADRTAPAGAVAVVAPLAPPAAPPPLNARLDLAVHAEGSCADRHVAGVLLLGLLLGLLHFLAAQVIRMTSEESSCRDSRCSALRRS